MHWMIFGCVFRPIPAIDSWKGEIRVNLWIWQPHHSPSEEQKTSPFGKLKAGMPEPENATGQLITHILGIERQSFKLWDNYGTYET